jgi:hypothetical protein
MESFLRAERWLGRRYIPGHLGFLLLCWFGVRLFQLLKKSDAKYKLCRGEKSRIWGQKGAHIWRVLTASSGHS